LLCALELAPDEPLNLSFFTASEVFCNAAQNFRKEQMNDEK
jgi:hypothetical protein